jgi:hypothetical protein
MNNSPSQSSSVMPVAVRARTVLAGCHHAWLQQDAAENPDDVALIDILDAGECPYLLLQPGAEFPVGPVRLTCTEVADQVGVLTVTGSLERQRSACETPDVVAALHLGEPCSARDEGGPGCSAVASDCPWCPAPGLSVMPVRVSEVHVASPRHARKGSAARSVTVDVDEFLAAEPDCWALHGATVARHLEVNHQRELLDLAWANGLPGVSAVSVRAADADGLVLTGIARDGVADVVLPFTPPLRDPRQLVRRLGMEGPSRGRAG